MLDIEPRNRPTAAQVCLHPWMKNSPSIGSHTPTKVAPKKASVESTNEKLTSAEVKVSRHIPEKYILRKGGNIKFLNIFIVNE